MSIDTWLHESVIGFHEDASDWGHEIDTDPRIGDGCDRWRSAARPPAQSDNTECTEEKGEMSNELTIVKISSC